MFLNIIFIIKHPSHDTSSKIAFHIGLTIAIVSILQTMLMVNYDSLFSFNRILYFRLLH